MRQETTNRSFDDLARALAEGSISRRRALKLFAGTAIASLIPSRVLAEEECVRVCHVPFDRETKECDEANARTICVSRRERRRHLENHPCDCQGRCANCLCLPDGGTCMANDDCCSGKCGEDHKCAPACTSNGGTCSTGGTPCCSGNCKGGTCVESCIPPGAISCDPNDGASCAGGALGGCICSDASEGGGYCITRDGSDIPCSTSCDCPAGYFCHPSFPTNFCVIAATVCPVG